VRNRLLHNGYEAGYLACPCFWGKEPSRLVRQLVENLGGVSGLSVLDAGCGEGKNAAFLATRGASVLAVDISAKAIANGKATWPNHPLISWSIGDVRIMDLAPEAYDIVVGYGLFHCLASSAEVCELIEQLQCATQPGGYHTICCFNAREQKLIGHPGFSPLLLEHAWLVDRYGNWEIQHESDENLEESHPNNNIAHSHSLTRILARKPR
jgi:tellurite methyltransferase